MPAWRVLYILTVYFIRSVHNVRIERIWRDLTRNFGAKWKLFFRDLEVHDGLDRDLSSHIWLLHYLFLPAINHEALTWAGAWNLHSIAIRHERQRSPNDMFFFGQIQNGIRGLRAPGHPVDGDLNADDHIIGDVQAYGIDWEEFEDRQINEHHVAANPSDDLGHENPFLAYKAHPHHLSHVEVEEVLAPLNEAQIQTLQTRLEELPYFASQRMEDRRQIWIKALHICEHLGAGHTQ